MSTPTLYAVTGKDDLLKQFKIERRKGERDVEIRLEKMESQKKNAQKLVDACQDAIDVTQDALSEMRQNTLVLYALKANPTLNGEGDAIAWLEKNGYIVNGSPSEKWNNA